MRKFEEGLAAVRAEELPRLGSAVEQGYHAFHSAYARALAAEFERLGVKSRDYAIQHGEEFYVDPVRRNFIENAAPEGAVNYMQVNPEDVKKSLPQEPVFGISFFQRVKNLFKSGVHRFATDAQVEAWKEGLNFDTAEPLRPDEREYSVYQNALEQQDALAAAARQVQPAAQSPLRHQAAPVSAGTRTRSTVIEMPVRYLSDADLAARQIKTPSRAEMGNPATDEEAFARFAKLEAEKPEEARALMKRFADGVRGVEEVREAKRRIGHQLEARARGEARQARQAALQAQDAVAEPVAAQHLTLTEPMLVAGDNTQPVGVEEAAQKVPTQGDQLGVVVPIAPTTIPAVADENVAGVFGPVDQGQENQQAFDDGADYRELFDEDAAVAFGPLATGQVAPEVQGRPQTAAVNVAEVDSQQTAMRALARFKKAEVEIPHITKEGVAAAMKRGYTELESKIEIGNSFLITDEWQRSQAEKLTRAVSTAPAYDGPQAAPVPR